MRSGGVFHVKRKAGPSRSGDIGRHLLLRVLRRESWEPVQFPLMTDGGRHGLNERFT
jgi:hypothetical protein